MCTGVLRDFCTSFADFCTGFLSLTRSKRKIIGTKKFSLKVGQFLVCEERLSYPIFARVYEA